MASTLGPLPGAAGAAPSAAGGASGGASGAPRIAKRRGQATQARAQLQQNESSRPFRCPGLLLESLPGTMRSQGKPSKSSQVCSVAAVLSSKRLRCPGLLLESPPCTLVRGSAPRVLCPRAMRVGPLLLLPNIGILRLVELLAPLALPRNLSVSPLPALFRMTSACDRGRICASAPSNSLSTAKAQVAGHPQGRNRSTPALHSHLKALESSRPQRSCKTRCARSATAMLPLQSAS